MSDYSCRRNNVFFCVYENKKKEQSHYSSSCQRSKNLIAPSSPRIIHPDHTREILIRAIHSVDNYRVGTRIRLHRRYGNSRWRSWHPIIVRSIINDRSQYSSRT